MMQLAIGSWRKFGGKQLMQPSIRILLKFSVTKCHLLREDDMELFIYLEEKDNTSLPQNRHTFVFIFSFSVFFISMKPAE